MEEKKFIKFKKEELSIKEYVKYSIGKGRISSVTIEYTPVGEKIVVATNKPGLVIGKKGEKIDELTRVLKKRFKLDNPHIEIKEIIDQNLDSRLVADDIALLLERQGSLKFKVIAYRMLESIMGSGALGAEIVLSGKLPSERAKSWRFSQGYLKKTGDTAKIVDRAMSQALTPLGVIGIKVSILAPDAKIHDRITIDAEALGKVRVSSIEMNTVKVEPEEVKVTKKRKTKKEAQNGNNKEE